MDIYSRPALDRAVCVLMDRYEKSAPTVAEWADQLYAAKDCDITLEDLFILQELANEDVPANYAANRIYHLMERQGKATIGHAGF